jgi:hypothetical protein
MLGRVLLILSLAITGSPPASLLAVTKDPQGVAALAQAITADGGAQLLGSVGDFTATGTITFFWAGQQVQGPATLRGRGTDQFRLDAVLSQGTRSYAVSHGWGKLKDTDGTVTPIPYHDTINIGVLSFPYLDILAELSDPLTAISYVGLVQNGDGTQSIEVDTQRQWPATVDPDGSLSALCVTKYFLDPQSYLVTRVQDMTHPVETFTEAYVHELDLGAYSVIGGINVPTLVAEQVGGQTIWQSQLTSINWNTGLTDQDFQLAPLAGTALARPPMKTGPDGRGK